jgi:hypothetical protein
LVKYIAKPDLIVGKQYRCLARNFEVGTWNGTGFDYMRYKFGHTFPDVEYHYDDGPPYGTVRPLEIVE